jgi:hypothetical protein
MTRSRSDHLTRAAPSSDCRERLCPKQIQEALGGAARVQARDAQGGGKGGPDRHRQTHRARRRLRDAEDALSGSLLVEKTARHAGQGLGCLQMGKMSGIFHGHEIGIRDQIGDLPTDLGRP